MQPSMRKLRAKMALLVQTGGAVRALRTVYRLRTAADGTGCYQRTVAYASSGA